MGLRALFFNCLIVLAIYDHCQFKKQNKKNIQEHIQLRGNEDQLTLIYFQNFILKHNFFLYNL